MIWFDLDSKEFWSWDKREDITCSQQLNYLQVFIHFLCVHLSLILSSLYLLFFPVSSSFLFTTSSNFSYPSFPPVFHPFPLLFPSSPSPFRPYPRPSPTSTPALCRNLTLSHSERLTLPSCFPVLLHCCHGETLCVYAGVCVCVCVCVSKQRPTLMLV